MSACDVVDLSLAAAATATPGAAATPRLAATAAATQCELLPVQIILAALEDIPVMSVEDQ